VKLLLEAGADVNAKGGDYGNALQAASSRGHESVVKLLLDAAGVRQRRCMLLLPLVLKGYSSSSNDFGNRGLDFMRK
jgi:ankyrin repeat protein